MSNILRLGGKTAGGLAAGISISSDGFININDTKQESMALGNIVYPESGDGIKTVFGLKVFNRIPVKKYSDKGKILLSGDTLYYLDVADEPNLYLLDANTLRVRRIVEIGHEARDFCVDESTVYLFGVGFSTYDLATGTLTKVSTTNYSTATNAYGSVTQDASHVYVSGSIAIRKINKANKTEEVVNHETPNERPFDRAVPMLFGNKLVITRNITRGSPSIVEVYDKKTMTLTGRVSGIPDVQSRGLVATKNELLLIGQTQIHTVNTNMKLDSSESEALSLKATLTGQNIFFVNEMDGGFVACGNKTFQIFNEDFSLRASVEMGNLGVFGDVSGTAYINPRPVSDNAGHVYMLGDNEILKISNELVVKGYRL